MPRADSIMARAHAALDMLIFFHFILMLLMLVASAV